MTRVVADKESGERYKQVIHETLHMLRKGAVDSAIVNLEEELERLKQ